MYNFFRELESENISLQEEYQHLKASSSSPTTGGSGSGSAPHSSSSSSGMTGNGGSYLMSVPAMSSDAEILQVRIPVNITFFFTYQKFATFHKQEKKLITAYSNGFQPFLLVAHLGCNINPKF